MMYMILFSLIIFSIGSMLTLISYLISEKLFFDREKSSPFECGFDPIIPSRLPFSLRFFIIAVVFLVFDVEIVLLLPLTSTLFSMNLNFWIFTYMSFVMILLVGTIYEWVKGALYWKY